MNVNNKTKAESQSRSQPQSGSIQSHALNPQLITPPIIPSAPYYMTPPQIIYLTAPCCNINNINQMNIVHNMTDNHAHGSSNIPLSFPSLDYQEPPRSNTPESDQHSIVSANTVNTTNTNNTTINTTINNTVLTSFSINDIDIHDINKDLSSKASAMKHSDDDDEYHIKDEEIFTQDEDDDVYIPPKYRSIKKKNKAKKKKRKKKKSKKKNKKRSVASCAYGVLPEAKGHRSISWSDLCETKLECHICDTVYADRAQYIDCLKAHYLAKDNDLVYLECELCINHPTKQSLERKERLLRNGEKDPNKWRQSKHVANFISHIAGHKGMKPGFYCKVKIWDNNKERHVRCGAPGSTLQNLAKHVYNMHYKVADCEDKYCVDPTYGYCEKSKLKKLHKMSRSTKKKTCGTKRKRTKTKKIKQESESEYAFSEDLYDEYVGYSRNRKKRKLNSVATKKTIVNDIDASTLIIPEAIGYQCHTLKQQNDFLSLLWIASAPKLASFADYVCDNKQIKH